MPCPDLPTIVDFVLKVFSKPALGLNLPSRGGIGPMRSILEILNVFLLLGGQLPCRLNGSARLDLKRD